MNDRSLAAVVPSAPGDRRSRPRRHIADIVLAAVLALLLAPATVRVVWGSSWSATLEITGVAAVLLAHSSVALRRTAPRWAFAAVGGLVALLVLTPPLGPEPEVATFSAVLVPSVLVFPVVLYSIAAWCPEPTSRLALGLSAAGGLLVLARLWAADYLTVAQPGLATDHDPVRSWPLFLLMGVVAMVVLPWWTGRYRRLRLLYVAELEERARREEDERAAEARRAVESERRRIALEMHDVVAHSLSVLVSQAEGGRMMATKDPAAAVPVLETIARAGRDAMHDMALRPQGPGPAWRLRRPSRTASAGVGRAARTSRGRPSLRRPRDLRGARGSSAPQRCSRAGRVPRDPGDTDQRAEAREPHDLRRGHGHVAGR